MEKTSPLCVHALDHVALYVRDLEASERFYGHALGLPRLSRPAFPYAGAWFALGPQQLHLIVDALHRDDERHSLHLAFQVEDARAAYLALLEAGVAVPSAPSVRSDGAVQLFFKDPDGYLLEMVSFPKEKGERKE